MTPTDEIDELLRQAGSRWRAGQPSAPEPDLERITRNSKPRRWVVPALAAASVATIATAALIWLPRGDEPVVAPSNDKAHPLAVRDGDRVEVSGQVVAAPGVPVRYCVPLPTTAQLDPGEKPPACAPGGAVELTGVDLNRLVDLRVIQGVTSGEAHLVGTWKAGTILVEQQGPPAQVQPEEPAPGVPCAPPAGGWKPGDASQSITPAVEQFVKARTSQLQNPWIGWPEGFPTETKPGAPPNKPSVLVIGVAHGDVAAVRRALDPLVAGNLCVTQVKVSHAEAAKQQKAVEALPAAEYGITSVGLGAGDRPVRVELRVLDEKTTAALQPIGLDTLDLKPYIRPVP
ncbi:hypothetical protein BWI15_17970 [Kribbella sp. ALI-6-A]|uniref:hypothetical protein n=1 Tax=Kribbella sp. ALI-6-A TaxID=1933817 RepID=UPI00097BF110|nr:hypothetical protein [Kribbella sp. ALI-6-A]ONI71986.1 hypothetical protein BWI15_17970 [Kribbella sp. ALI-6-A]